MILSALESACVATATVLVVVAAPPVGGGVLPNVSCAGGLWRFVQPLCMHHPAWCVFITHVVLHTHCGVTTGCEHLCGRQLIQPLVAAVAFLGGMCCCTGVSKGCCLDRFGSQLPPKELQRLVIDTTHQHRRHMFTRTPALGTAQDGTDGKPSQTAVTSSQRSRMRLAVSGCTSTRGQQDTFKDAWGKAVPPASQAV